MSFQYITFHVCYIFSQRGVTATKTTLELLRDLREDHDMSQRQVAEVLGISQQQYSQYENGGNELPLRHFAKLTELFDVSADYLLGRTQRPASGSVQNVLVTRDCSCTELVDKVLALSGEGRKAVLEYVAFQQLKEKSKTP